MWFSHETLRAVRRVARPLDYPCVSSWITRRIQWVLRMPRRCLAHVPYFYFYFCAHAAHRQTGQHQLITCGKKEEREGERGRREGGERCPCKFSVTVRLSVFRCMLCHIDFDSMKTAAVFRESSLGTIESQTQPDQLIA